MPVSGFDNCALAALQESCNTIHCGHEFFEARSQWAMCGRLRVGKENLHVAGLVGAAMCSASHDGFSVKGREGQQNVIQGGALIPAGFPAKPHIRWELIPSHCPAFGTGELQENGTTLCRRRRSATPNNGDVPSDHRLLGTRIASRIGDWSGSRLQDCTSRYDAVGDEPP
jgi:hypothetical protein